MSNVLAVSEPKPWSNGDGVTYWVTLDDRTEDVPCYSDQAAALKIHEPLPDGWELGKSSKGKDKLTPPKSSKGGGGGFSAAFRNTQEGFLLEQDSIHRSVALKLSVKMRHPDDQAVAQIVARADRFYQWLSGIAVATVSDNGEAQTSPSNVVGPAGDGEAPAGPTTHEHQWVPSPKLKSFDICVLPDCYETKKRAVADV